MSGWEIALRLLALGIALVGGWAASKTAGTRADRLYRWATFQLLFLIALGVM